ncbi:MAG: 2-oxoacid:ferredoxin oxidoreductase subunit beta [Paludibacter sp.]|nr:2-oxoacid:ferredoxin oxidoreductase subunit beta [Bacteroidales bacterium]MCM1069914.1 2-oxoacid:ferredoxin oxidoreductase subunit beta [Prevotella sp.]MCM1354669.1 2-oxoacid:ferredoxin oxidoreductase subunit beta [Bacteroides sp.]MCM1443490.1 2-oxoacid:ferredoxin oxidoreductase subunit beta [Muribaculum sp.]MCM1482596.1 2-oxoacid:ferredoxin oxidoreductase subunit beta [Paludibacter sp.]
MDATQFKSDQYVRFCPGCGDHAICTALQRAMAQTGVPTHQTVVISGIGCSSRMPHYLNTYGFNTIHGRGAAIATGVKTSHPELSVWQITGDGDCLAIGGNHFIHSLRRNIDINICLFNNRIYGLTKGQYSPTSPKGFVSKSSPYGTVERPFIPAELVMGARGTFFARTLDVDLPTTINCMLQAHQHKGASVIECLVNCVIFNNGTHSWISDKATRADRTLLLEHGQPMIFGAERNKGLILEGWNLRVVTIGENGITENDILIHDATTQDDTLHRKLALMQGPDFPIALGVIRNVECETYDQAVNRQIAEVQNNARIHNFDELIASCEQWEI